MGAQRSAASHYQRRAGQPRHVVLGRDAGAGVTELQRSRMLSSAVQVVMERGYGQMSVARVTGGAGVSRRTFYELFEDREACFLAAFDQAVAEISTVAAEGWNCETIWHERIRAALAAILQLLDERPGVGLLVVVEALGAGPRVLKHRAKLLSQLAELVDQGRLEAGKRRQPSSLISEGIVGAVLGVIHARLLEKPPVALTRLLSPLMSMIVAPYLGEEMAARELGRPAPRKATHATEPAAVDPLKGLNMRITFRTLKVVSVIAGAPGASNRAIADQAGVTDQGQISKLLARLESLGLIQNTVPGQPTGEPNQWRLTPRGHEVHQVIQDQSSPESAHSEPVRSSR